MSVDIFVSYFLQTLWLERTTIYTKFTFPGILCWFEATAIDMVCFVLFFYLFNFFIYNTKVGYVLQYGRDINRGYYMAARRYEISLREEKFRISKRSCNVLFII